MQVPWQVVAILILLLGFVDWSRSNAIERAAAAEIAAASEKAARKYVEKTAALSQDFNEKLAEKDREHTRQLGNRETEINQLRLTADRLARVDPLGFGDDYHVRLARVMCRIQAGTDNNSRETCDNAPAEAYLADVAFTLTVTADNAEIWREQCEDGNRDFCEWSLTGFTPQAALTLLTYMERVDAYALEQGEHIDGLHDLIKAISANSDPENGVGKN